jgi:hypothetical protein
LNPLSTATSEELNTVFTPIVREMNQEGIAELARRMYADGWISLKDTSEINEISFLGKMRSAYLHGIQE